MTSITGNGKIFFRQGEAADYVFSNTETANGTYTGIRTWAKKFSPYNLTAAAMTDDDVNPNYVQVGYQGGV